MLSTAVPSDKCHAFSHVSHLLARQHLLLRQLRPFLHPDDFLVQEGAVLQPLFFQHLLPLGDVPAFSGGVRFARAPFGAQHLGAVQLRFGVYFFGRRLYVELQEYKGTYPAETADFDASVESICEFDRELARIERDDLPKYSVPPRLAYRREAVLSLPHVFAPFLRICLLPALVQLFTVIGVGTPILQPFAYF